MRLVSRCMVKIIKLISLKESLKNYPTEKMQDVYVAQPHTGLPAIKNSTEINICR